MKIIFLILVLFLISCAPLTQEELAEKYGPLEAGESIFDDEEKEDDNGDKTGN